MDTFSVYKDIQARTDGQLLAGVVGPVRTGKSTFIRRFMEVFALPSLKEEQQTEIKDTLPVSGSGKLITTVEPKFIPREAIPVTLGEEISVKLRLIDCVGYLIPEASGNLEDGRERMVKTPWFDHEIPFHQAAELGTRKVIRDHSTIGFLVTCDGSFGEIPRENYVSSEERTVKELKETGKPFLIILNSQKPFKEETRQLAKQLQEKYQVSVLPVNCEQLRKDDVIRILEKNPLRVSHTAAGILHTEVGGAAAGCTSAEGGSDHTYSGNDAAVPLCPRRLPESSCHGQRICQQNGDE